MRKIREVLRLRASGYSQTQIAHSSGISRSTVGDYVRCAQRAGIHWPLEGLDDQTLEQRLFPPPPKLA